MKKKTIKALSYLGERCVIEARTNHTYKDQTGALTASIGYLIFKNGEVVNGSFARRERTPVSMWEVVKKGEKTTPEDGAEKGKELAEKVGKETTRPLFGCSCRNELRSLC